MAWEYEEETLLCPTRWHRQDISSFAILPDNKSELSTEGVKNIAISRTCLHHHSEAQSSVELIAHRLTVYALGIKRHPHVTKISTVRMNINS